MPDFQTNEKIVEYIILIVRSENIHDHPMLLPSGSISSFKSMNSNECLMENLRISVVNAENNGQKYK